MSALTREVALRLKMRIQHEPLLAAMEKKGYNQRTLGKALGISGNRVNPWVNLREVPSKEMQRRIEEVLIVLAEDLWPEWFCERIRAGLVTKHEVSRVVNEAQLDHLSLASAYNERLLLQESQNPEQDFIKGEQNTHLARLLDESNLTPREAKILKMRFLEDPRPTLDACGMVFGVSKERVMQIVETALRKVRSRAREGGYARELANEWVAYD